MLLTYSWPDFGLRSASWGISDEQGLHLAKTQVSSCRRHMEWHLVQTQLWKRVFWLKWLWPISQVIRFENLASFCYMGQKTHTIFILLSIYPSHKRSNMKATSPTPDLTDLATELLALHICSPATAVQQRASFISRCSVDATPCRQQGNKQHKLGRPRLGEPLWDNLWDNLGDLGPRWTLFLSAKRRDFAMGHVLLEIEGLVFFFFSDMTSRIS